MKRTVLVAGGHGFVGRHTARAFKSAGFDVWAIGRGVWVKNDRTSWGIDQWTSGEITLDQVSALNMKPDFIINCAGSSSVGASFENPLVDFKKTVESTKSILEFIRLKSPQSKLVQLSSPAVQGIHDDTPIKIDDPKNPVSPYGSHKKEAEDLCSSYGMTYGVNVAIIRFFSLYGPGLKKQLLWDACNKMKNSTKSIEFWGSGNETRDWLYIDDAISLIMKVIEDKSPKAAVFNGGSGIRYTIHDTLATVANAFGASTPITFNGRCRPGDPQFYQADISGSLKLGWSPRISLQEGIRRYVHWFKEETV